MQIADISFTIIFGIKLANIEGIVVNKTPKYIALLVASALLLNGCDKVGSFFGKEKKPEQSSSLVKTINVFTKILI